MRGTARRRRTGRWGRSASQPAAAGGTAGGGGRRRHWPRRGTPPAGQVFSGRAGVRSCFDLLRAPDDPGHGEGHAEGDGHHDDVLQRHVQVQQDAEDAGDAGAGGTQPHDAGIQRAAGAAGQTAEEGLEVAQIHAEDGRFGDAHAGGQGGRQSHGLDLGVAGLEGNGQSGAALRHVGGAGQRQPVGVAVAGQLTQIDQGVHVVDTGHDGDRVQAAHEEGADAVGQGDEGLHAGDDAVFQFGEHGADGGQGQVTGDEHGHQRGDEQVKHGGHYLVQPLFDLAHEPHRDDDRDDVPLIAHQRHRVQTAEHGLHHVDTVRDGPCVLQVGMDHDHADDRAQIRVAAEHLSGRVGDDAG